MDIQHFKGKENRVANALSRKLYGIYAMYFSQSESRLLDQLKEEAQKDPEYNSYGKKWRMIGSKAYHKNGEEMKIK